MLTAAGVRVGAGLQTLNTHFVVSWLCGFGQITGFWVPQCPHIK